MNPAPAMFLVTGHHGRTFVLLGGSVPETEKLSWWRDMNSYDNTAIAAAPALPYAMQLTLVGDKSTRTLTTRHQVFIQPAFEARRSMTALEIDRNRERPFRIAVEGKHTTSWEDVEYEEKVSADTIAWAQNPGFTPPLDTQFISVRKLGTLELITAYGTDGAGPATYFRVTGGKPWGGYKGRPMGAVTVDGVRYVVLVDNGVVTPIRA